jgi:hypothetical protein
MIKLRRMRQARQAECVGERRGAYMVLVGKSGGKRPSWFFRKWDWRMDWIDLSQDRDG